MEVCVRMGKRGSKRDGDSEVDKEGEIKRDRDARVLS